MPNAVSERYGYYLTTIDNPFDPCNQFDSWYLYDELHGYGTCGLLARFAKTSDALSDAENADEINDAITRIIALDPFNIYKRVKKPIEGESSE